MKIFGAWLQVLDPSQLAMLGVVPMVLLMLWQNLLGYLMMKLYRWRRIPPLQWMLCIWILVFLINESHLVPVSKKKKKSSNN